MVRKLLCFTAIVFATSMSAHAQEIPKAEFAATYSMFVADIDALDNETMHGYGLSAQGNINRYFAVVGEWSATHGSSGPVTVAQPGTIRLIQELDTRVYTFLVGPRVTYRTSRTNVFGHWLMGYGDQKVEDEVTNLRFGNGEFAMALGGGLDIFIGKQFSIRAAQFDYLPINTDINLRLTRPNGAGASSISTDSSSWTQNARFQTGIVFRFGAK